MLMSQFVQEVEEELKRKGIIRQIAEEIKRERRPICPNKHPEPHQYGEFPMSCYSCHMYADS